MHLLIDARLKRRLSREEITAWLEVAPAAIGMTPIAPVIVIPLEDGFTGIQLIAESHIKIEVRNDLMLVWVDLFSYKEFSASRARDHARRALGLREIRSQILARGLEYLSETPTTVALACVKYAQPMGAGIEGEGNYESA